jgi:dTDP-4-amino-4,6-dideoxygalactose transaminase
MYRQLPSSDLAKLPQAMALSRQVLCLPMAAGLEAADQDRVIGAIRQEMGAT